MYFLGFRAQSLGLGSYLEGRGDLISGLILRITITRVLIWVIGVITVLK